MGWSHDSLSYSVLEKVEGREIADGVTECGCWCVRNLGGNNHLSIYFHAFERLLMEEVSRPSVLYPMI